MNESSRLFRTLVHQTFSNEDCQSFIIRVVYFNITMPWQRIVSNDINIMLPGPSGSVQTLKTPFYKENEKEKKKLENLYRTIAFARFLLRVSTK